MFADRSRAAGWALLLVAIVASVSAGCSGVHVPFAPGPSFVPAGTPSPTAAGPDRLPDADLTGRLDTTDGLTATVRTTIWFGEVTRAPHPTRRHPEGWITVHLPITGTTTITNSAAVPNPAATSVYYVIYAGYPDTSLLCRRLEADRTRQTPGRCWRQLATATPFSYTGTTADRLAPGHSGADTFGESPAETGVWVDIPATDDEKVATELAHPADLVVLTARIYGIGTAPWFARACGQLRPTSATAPGVDDPDQQVLVGTLHATTCVRLPTR